MSSDSKNGSLNKYGGERAVCPKCHQPDSELYEFLKEDHRELECSNCHKSSPFLRYFPKTCAEVFH